MLDVRLREYLREVDVTGYRLAKMLNLRTPYVYNVLNGKLDKVPLYAKVVLADHIGAPYVVCPVYVLGRWKLRLDVEEI